MSEENETTLNMKKLNDLVAMLAKSDHVIRVGVLGKGNGRNAEIGAAHEYGTSKLPQRSFLRMPMSEHLYEYVARSSLNSVVMLDSLIEKQDFMPWFKQLSKIAERVVLDGFDSGGFGKWAPHSAGYTNNTGNILVDTAQLRNSITSEVL